MKITFSFLKNIEGGILHEESSGNWFGSLSDVDGSYGLSAARSGSDGTRPTACRIASAATTAACHGRDGEAKAHSGAATAGGKSVDGARKVRKAQRGPKGASAACYGRGCQPCHVHKYGAL